MYQSKYKQTLNADKLSLLVTACLIFFAITLSPFGEILESSMPAHVLIEIPLLIAVGMIIAQVFDKSLNRFFYSLNRGGIFGILLTTVVLAFWMIPRWLDASLNYESVAWAKYLTLPFFVGIPLACSWSLLHPIARGVVKIEFLSMLFRLGWLYIISPDRLCNNYLINDQEFLGKGFLVIGIIVSIAWLIPVFFGNFIEDDVGQSQNMTRV